MCFPQMPSYQAIVIDKNYGEDEKEGKAYKAYFTFKIK